MESAKLFSPARLARETSSPAFDTFLKRSFDIALSAVALLCVLPILLVAMIAIVFESSGSPIFMQLRVGRRGKVFRIFKLRTMYDGSDSLDYKTRNQDNRLTKVGTWLRRLNLDELPQLVNVLTGEMSVIGPRPLSVTETIFLTGQGGFSKDYPGLVPAMRPGLVGLEQVNRNKDLTYAERFEYNCDYQSNWSINNDLQILLKAVVLCSPVCCSVISGALFVWLLTSLH